jgi:hypothetical protein
MEAPKRKYYKHKTEVKISIKYQLNTNAKPVASAFDDSNLYPVYITVSVNRQFTRFRSRIRSLTPVDGLDEELGCSTNKEFIDNEVSTIESTLRSFIPESKVDFKLSDWSRHYATGLIEVSSWVDFIINKKISDIIRSEFEWNLTDYETLPSDIQASLHTLRLLGSRTAKTLFEEFSPILNLKAIEAAIRIKEGHNHSYCLWDVYNKFYQNRLSSFLGADALPIISLLESLFESVAYNEDFSRARNMLSQKSIL